MAMLNVGTEAARRLYFRDKPHMWMHEIMGIDLASILWEYANHPEVGSDAVLDHDPETGEKWPVTKIITPDEYGRMREVEYHDPYANHEWRGDREPIYNAAMEVARGTRRVAAYGATGCSKCVRGETLVETELGLVPIRDLVEDAFAGQPMAPDSYRPLHLRVGSRDGAALTSHAYYGGVKRVYDVQTRRGYRLGGSGTHRVVVLVDGRLEWKHCRDLEPGDRVAIRVGADVWGSNPEDLSEDIAYALGALVGDGSFASRKNTVTLCTDDPEIVEAVKNAVEQEGLYTGTTVSANRIDTVRINGGAWDLLERVGLKASRAESKEVPPAVMQGTKPVVRAFLQGLFDTDGGGGEAVIDYCTVSETLARQVHALLLRFGVVSTLAVREPKYTYRGEVRQGQTAYVLSISGHHAARFEQNIGFRLERKRCRLSLPTNQNTNLDTFPCGRLVKALLVRGQERFGRGRSPLSKSVLGKKYGTVMSWTSGARSPSRDSLLWLLETARDLSDTEEWQAINTLATCPYYFDEVESVEEDEAEVYDLTVPKTESFIGNGFVNHNTTLLGAGLALWYLDMYPESQVVGFAPKLEQLKDSWLKEVFSFSGCLKPFYPNLSKTSTELFIDKERYGKKWSLMARTATVQEGEDSATPVQGLHANRLLVFLEEMPGIKRAVLNAIFKTAGGSNNQIMVVGNPKHRGDALQKFCESKRTKSFHVCGLDYPNVVTGYDIVPGALSRDLERDLLADAMADLGTTDEDAAREWPNYKVAILGLWPETSEDGYIKAPHLMAAQQGLVQPVVAYEHDLPAEGWTRILREPVTVEEGPCEGAATHRWRYWMFLDLASSYDVTEATRMRSNGEDPNGLDWHAGVMFDAVTDQVVATVHMRGPMDHFARACLRVCDRYTLSYPRDAEEVVRKSWSGKEMPTLAWERQGVGAGFVTTAWDLKGASEERSRSPWKGERIRHDEIGRLTEKSIRDYRRIYRKILISKGHAKETQIVGHDTNSSAAGGSRMDMMEKLHGWAMGFRVHPGRVGDEAILNELRTLVRKTPTREGQSERVEHQDGAKDDLVMATAGALFVSHMGRLIGRYPKGIETYGEEAMAEAGRPRERTGSGRDGYGVAWKSSYA